MAGLARALAQSRARHAARQLAQMLVAMNRDAGQIQARMKETHPWRNRTYNAEKSLGAEVAHPVRTALGTSVDMRVGYIHVPVQGAPQRSDPMVKYGKFLELANAGRWAVVRPTMRRMVPTILAHAMAARRIAGGVL